MIRKKTFLILDKCRVIARYCEQNKTEDAFAAVGDFTEAVTDLMKDVMAAGEQKLTALFGSELFLKSLQQVMAAMSEKDSSILAGAIKNGMIPVFEKACGIVNPDLADGKICGVTGSDPAQGKANEIAGMASGQAGGSGPASDTGLKTTGGLSLWSDSEAEQWAKTIDYDGKPRAVCMFGNADGMCAAALRERLSDDSLLIIYEPEKDSIPDLKEELAKNIDYYRQQSLMIVEHPLYREIFRHEYAEFIRAINDNREHVMVNRNTLARFKEDAPRNVIRNLPMLAGTNLISDLGKILPADIPVIIVAAGPSLDKNIEELRRAKGHALIFAVDTAMKYLMSHDIIPDLAITIEPIKPMANYEDDRCFDVPHVFDSESNPEIVSKQHARTFIYNCRDYVKRLLNSLGKDVPPDVPSGGSVATAAFAICYQLQMKRIIMIGQDLAYQGEATHAGGVESKGINNNIGCEMIDGIDGGKVRTRSDWLAYLKWFESAIALIKDSGYDIEVIDATEGGALIHGSTVMTLAEAIDGYCTLEYDFAAELEKLPYMLNDTEYEEIWKLVRKSAIELDMVRDTAKEAARLCGDEIENGTDSSRREALKTLAQARRTCENALAYPLINNYAVTGIADEVSRLRLEKTGEESELMQQKLAFEAIVDACGYFSGVFAEYL